MHDNIEKDIGVVYNEQAISIRFQVYNNRLGLDMKWESLSISIGRIIFMFPHCFLQYTHDWIFFQEKHDLPPWHLIWPCVTVLIHVIRFIFSNEQTFCSFVCLGVYNIIQPVSLVLLKELGKIPFWANTYKVLWKYLAGFLV